MLNVSSRLVAAESAEPRFMQEEEESSEEEEEELSPEKQGQRLNLIICHAGFPEGSFLVEPCPRDHVTVSTLNSMAADEWLSSEHHYYNHQAPQSPQTPVY